MSIIFRIIVFVFGIFLIILAATSILDLQSGTVPLQQLAYLTTLKETATPVSSVTEQAATIQAGSTQPALTQVVQTAAVTNTSPPTNTPVIAQVTATPSPILSPATATVNAAFTRLAIMPLLYYATPVRVLGKHIVQNGEYLYCIGRAYGVLPQAIADINSLSLQSHLYVGQALLIPDVRWDNIPTGAVCKSQFTSPYPAPPTPTLPSLGMRFSPESESAKFHFTSFLSLNEKQRQTDLQSPADTTDTPEPETRTITVKLPKEMRLGTSGQVQLTFDPVTGQVQASTPNSAQPSPVAVTNTLEPNFETRTSRSLFVPAVFDKYRILAIARLDAVGFSYSPDGDVQKEVTRGTSLTWRWSIKPQEAEPQQIIINLSLHFEPKGEQDFWPDEQIWSDSFELSVTKNIFQSLFGNQASLFAIFSGIIGSLASLSSIWDKIPGRKKAAEKVIPVPNT